MIRFHSLAALLLAWVLATGCSHQSGGSAGAGSGPGAGSGSGSRTFALVLAVADGAIWEDPATGKWVRLEVGMELPEGAIVESGGGSGVELRLPGEGGTMTVAPKSRVRLANLDEEGSMEVWVMDGRVEGRLTAGSLKLINACGGFLAVTPQSGMAAPFSFGNTMSDEMWEAVIGLGLNPGMMQSSRENRGALEQVPQAFIAGVRTPVIIPEPHPGVLALLGGGMMTGLVCWRRKGSRSGRA